MDWQAFGFKEDPLKEFRNKQRDKNEFKRKFNP
jgi:hypothetical protein